MKEIMLTTIDNPFNPFTEFEEWEQYDINNGYFTNAYLARIAKISDDLSEADEDRIIQDAIDEILREDILGIYMKSINSLKGGGV